MDLSFSSTGLAALCNAELLMVESWGQTWGRTIGKRLLDLTAATDATIERIPTSSLLRGGDGAITITFDDTISITGRLTPSGEGGGPNPDEFVISDIRVKEAAS